MNLQLYATFLPSSSFFFFCSFLYIFFQLIPHAILSLSLYIHRIYFKHQTLNAAYIHTQYIYIYIYVYERERCSTRHERERHLFIFLFAIEIFFLPISLSYKKHNNLLLNVGDCLDEVTLSSCL